MPTLDINVLIRSLEGTRVRLYELYVRVLDLGVADALLRESLHIEQIITQLRKLVTPK